MQGRQNFHLWNTVSYLRGHHEQQKLDLPQQRSKTLIVYQYHTPNSQTYLELYEMDTLYVTLTSSYDRNIIFNSI